MNNRHGFHFTLLANLFPASFAFAVSPPCTVDPSHVEVAKATGGSVFCGKNVSASMAVSSQSFRLQPAYLTFEAAWKVPGHGSMDRYLYAWDRVPSGRIRVVLNRIPRDVMTITDILAFNEQGKISKSAKLMNRIADGTHDIETWEIDALRGKFKLALMGKTTSGEAFVMYSSDEAEGQSESDEEMGRAWYKAHGKKVLQGASKP